VKLGLSVKVLGKPGLKSHDTRRWQSDPHLSVSLVYLRDIMHYMRHSGIRMYRMASELAPYVAHPDLPQFHDQIDECQAELAAVGAIAREDGLRLSFHPGSFVVLDTPDSDVLTRSCSTLSALTRIQETMGLGPEAVIVLHVGGEYGDHSAALNRFVDATLGLPQSVRSRLVLEHDHAHFSLSDCYNVHLRTGLPIVYDHQHQLLHNPERLPVQEGLQLALSTWPQGVQPKIHFSSPRTELRTVSRQDSSGRKRELLQPPLWTQHADYVHPFEFIALLRQAEGLPSFDVLLECKAKDLALLRLRADLARFAPDLAANLEGLETSMLTDTGELYEGEIESLDGIDPGTLRVLVAVMNNPRDLQLAREQGWYRIPVRRAPRQVAADVLAFYQTAAFDEPERWTITHYAPIRKYRIVRRTELLPDEGDHPRADEEYYKVEIGSLQQLASPIPSRNLRRITFIPTTMDRLLGVGEINGLWMGSGLQERLWAEQERLWAEYGGLETEIDQPVPD
jgi:UV DNA damage endonuclease